jgi:hypothetical protein
MQMLDLVFSFSFFILWCTPYNCSMHKIRWAPNIRSPVPGHYPVPIITVGYHKIYFNIILSLPWFQIGLF